MNFYFYHNSFFIKTKKSTIQNLTAHIKHFIEIGGVECVGLGTDFDGITGDPIHSSLQSLLFQMKSSPDS